ncbi:MAG: ferric reductase-like transmembrane domain-containing protein [Rhizobiaceae bacterium]
MAASTPVSLSGKLIRIAVWAGLSCATIGPVIIAAFSPLLDYRSAAYVVAGLSGASALALMLLQPLLAAGYLPGLRLFQSRNLHRWIGMVIVAGVVLHIGGLYLTSPPDALDALLLVSPTPFSVYGVIGMWGLVVTVLLVMLRDRLGLRPRLWRTVHNGVVTVVVASSVAHALMIDGTMGFLSKQLLCVAIIVVLALVTLNLRIIRPMMQKRT